jgi:hypothetical protein
MTGANLPALSGQLRQCGMSEGAIYRLYATFNVIAFSRPGADR